MLYEAFDSYESETNPNGRPAWESLSGDDNLGYMVLERIDESAAELATYDDEQAKKDKPTKGLSRWVQPVMRDGSSVPEGGLARERWMEMMAQRASEEQQMIEDIGAVQANLAGLVEDMPAGGYDPSEYGDGIVG